MAFASPLDTVRTLLEARARKDVDAAVACYEADASVVIEPGKVLSGAAAIRAFTEGAMNLPLVFGAREIVAGAAAALHLCRWAMQVPDGSGGTTEVVGCTADVLRLQADGRWLFSIDNGWGAAIVPP
jgi:ketosteroid isomerase-like protein